MDEHSESNPFFPAIAVGIILLLLVVVSFLSSKTRTGTVVLPGGITYLGPTPATPTVTPHLASGKITVPPETKWSEYVGRKYPYRFLYPASLSLGVFPNDPYDSVTVFTTGSDGSNNIFFRVEDLNALGKSAYVNRTEDYVRDWWKSYSWKGVKRVTAFTNANGLKGYRASYTDSSGATPYDHVFLAVPGKPELLVWLSAKLFDDATFARIVDSVSWKE